MIRTERYSLSLATSAFHEKQKRRKTHRCRWRASRRESAGKLSRRKTSCCRWLELVLRELRISPSVWTDDTCESQEPPRGDIERTRHLIQRLRLLKNSLRSSMINPFDSIRSRSTCRPKFCFLLIQDDHWQSLNRGSNRDPPCVSSCLLILCLSFSKFFYSLLLILF